MADFDPRERNFDCGRQTALTDKFLFSELLEVPDSYFVLQLFF